MKNLNGANILLLILLILLPIQNVLAAQIENFNQLSVDDMILDESALSENNFKDGISTQAAGGYSEYDSQAWPKAVLPVAFSSEITPTQKDWFIKIAQKWVVGNRLRIINRTKEKDYLLVTNQDPGCFSEVGARIGRIRQLNLGPNCWTEGVALHEIGHALGLMHEHQRPDRDSYIKINYNNVDPNLYYAFALFSRSNHSTTYDFQSIMHYGQYAFSMNGKVTVNVRPEYSKYQSLMGIKKISGQDLKAISNMYANLKK